MSIAVETGKTLGPWNPDTLEKLHEWDPQWTEMCARMTTNPWKNGILSRRLVELIGVALNAACTNLNAEGTRRHISAALEAGASRDEVLMVLKCAAVMSIHSCSLGVPILLEEAKAAGMTAAPKAEIATPACDQMRAAGQWNEAWNPIYGLDPAWTDEFMATAFDIYGGGVLNAKEIELLSIAFDASYTHMYGPGTRRHIKGALRAGATIEEIMAVLELCVMQGMEALNLGVPLLAYELQRQRVR